MSSRSLNRKDFLIVSVTAVTASVIAACGGDDPVTPSGTAGTGTGGSGTAGTGTAGTGTAGTGTAGTGTAGTTSGGTSAGTGGASGGTGGASGGTGGVSGGTGGASGGSGGKGGAGGTGGGGGSGGGGGGGKCGADISIMSSGGHQHSLLVTAAQINAGTDVTILSGASNGHSHYVKITAADFTALKAGTEVKKKSCAGGDHEYVLKCGGGASAGGAPTCTDECGDDDNMSSACN